MAEVGSAQGGGLSEEPLLGEWGDMAGLEEACQGLIAQVAMDAIQIGVGWRIDIAMAVAAMN